jgi:hypothetical protein
MRSLLATARSGLVQRFRRVRTDAEIAERAFDRAFYLARQPDVAAAGGDPFEHFMVFGWREGRDPTPDFSVNGYLATYPEVEALGVNPFIHYLTNGRPRILPPEPKLGFRHAVIEQLASLDERIAAATAGDAAPAPQAELAAALTRSRDGLRRLHVTFSHDDFTANLGGLQLCLGREAARVAERGRDHLHLHPAKPWPVVRTRAEPGLLGVVWNGARLGVFEPADIAATLGAAAAGAGDGRSFAIHSLLGHAADETADILAAAGLRAGTFWLHDFASVCAGFHLLRNDVEDCGGPPADSAACDICVYGPGRARHATEHARLFQRLSLSVAAPSAVTLHHWRATSGLTAVAEHILPHAALSPRGPAAVPPADRPFRLAYAGLPTAHKGWPIFRGLARRFMDDPRYEFLHLGACRDSNVQARFQSVAVGVDNPLAMRDALAAAEVDAVLVWPLCRETFSFVAYEAVAAGAAVLTGPDSGNVAAFVAETGQGQVLADEAVLGVAFETGAVLDLARARRKPMLYDLTFSALSLDLPEERRP